MPTYEDLKILVTVKAYPNLTKHGEAVCVAGIDVNAPRWIRLFPVNYRDLPWTNQFKKYQIITLRAAKAKNDRRPESYTPDVDSIQVLSGPIPPKDGWKKRLQIIEGVPDQNLCRLQDSQPGGESLGWFRPSEVMGFDVEEDRTPFDPAKVALAQHPSLFAPNLRDKTELEKIPFRFLYRFRCGGGNCPSKGHRLSIIDWEIGALFRNLKTAGDKEEDILRKVREKWFDEMCGESRGTHFYVGNQHQHLDTFMVLGVASPKRN